MNKEVKVGPDGKGRRVLPRLEALAVDEVVEGFPVVVDWIGRRGQPVDEKENGKRGIAPSSQSAIAVYIAAQKRMRMINRKATRRLGFHRPNAKRMFGSFSRPGSCGLITLALGFRTGL
jgi:hypothetical protein